jgi:hypothetical protein
MASCPPAPLHLDATKICPISFISGRNGNTKRAGGKSVEKQILSLHGKYDRFAVPAFPVAVFTWRLAHPLHSTLMPQKSVQYLSSLDEMAYKMMHDHHFFFININGPLTLSIVVVVLSL